MACQNFFWWFSNAFLVLGVQHFRSNLHLPHEGIHMKPSCGFFNATWTGFAQQKWVLLKTSNVRKVSITACLEILSIKTFTSCLENRSACMAGYVATVVRNGPVGFSFTNMVDFNIYSLAFTSYNRSWSYGSHPASNFVLLLQSTQYAKLVNCSFHDNIGTALTVLNTNVTLIEIKFMHNQCACESFSEMPELGCGITTFNSNLIFTGSTTFHNNTHSFLFLVLCWSNLGISKLNTL